MHDAAAIERIRTKFQALTVVMDERMRRQWAAAEAMELGWGGISHVAYATGLSRTTILAGVRELKAQQTTQAPPSPGIRRRWSQAVAGNRSGFVGRLGRFGGSHDPWPSGDTVALDLQEYSTTGRGTYPTASPG